MRRHALLFFKARGFVLIPHQLFEASGQGAALVLREKPAHFAGLAVRLEYESAGVQRRRRGVEFNRRPMSRKYREMFTAPVAASHGDRVLVDGDRLARAASPHRSADGPRE